LTFLNTSSVPVMKAACVGHNLFIISRCSQVTRQSVAYKLLSILLLQVLRFSKNVVIQVLQM